MSKKISKKNSKKTSKLSRGNNSDNSENELSGLTFLHKIVKQSVENDKVSTYEENVIDGARGLFIKFYSKENNNIKKITVHKNSDGTYTAKIDGNTETLNSVKDLQAFVKKTAELDFAKKYVSGLKEQKGGVKKSSKRTKKASKKASKKTSKKTSKKSSKKINL